jgi:deoxyribonuclease IV
MKFGAHVSIAGGVQNAPLNASAIGCEVFQMFTRSPQGGPAPKLTTDVVEAFQTNCRLGKFSQWVIHTPYYINLASNSATIRSNSARVIREELERGTVLGAAYVMFHPGSAKDVGEAKGTRLVIEMMKKLLDGYSGTTELLIEISAGAGMVIGDTFEEIATILEGVGHPDVGVCFDTAHAFASGYDLRSKKAIDATMKRFDATIGLKRLKISHCNDSKVELSSHRDRHEHIGDGFIGRDGFKALIRHPAWKNINLYLETEPGGVEKDLRLLKKLRG